MKHYLYYQNDKSNKFWTIELIGSGYKTTNGRVGATPRETNKEFLSEEDAMSAIEKQVKSKLRKGYKEGDIPTYEKPDWSSIPMNNKTFWRILGLFNWGKQGDDEAVIKPAVLALSQMKVEAIYKFEDILSEQLFYLDTKAHAREIGEEGYKEDTYFSSDWFLYSRCTCLINGEDFYNEVLNNPSSFPKDMEFETLITVAQEAFEKKTKEEWNYNCKQYSYESFSNEKGWS